MTHFAYPNTNTRQKQTIFIGCGRFVAAPEPPTADYHDAAPKMTQSLDVLYAAVEHFAPEALAIRTRIYETKDRPAEAYQGDSMGLAYLLALISRGRSLTLTDMSGDFWCTGDIIKQHGDQGRFGLCPVGQTGFRTKLSAFLAPENPDRLFIAPFANIGDDYHALADIVTILRASEIRRIPQSATDGRKILLLVGAEELPLLLDLLFIAPANQPKMRSRQHRPRTYVSYPTYPYFVGRTTELRQIIDEIHSEKKYTIIVNAMGGIGKTVLASHVVETIKSEFQGVYYKKCTPDSDADELLAELAYFFEERGDPTLAEAFEYAAQQEPKINALIESLNAHRYLLLFDDLHDILDRKTSQIIRHDLQLFFEHLLMQAHQSKIFLISRTQPVLDVGLVRQAVHQLDGLDMEAAFTFLRDLEVSDDPNVLRQVYDFTHGHPVSMQLLAELKRTMPLQEILTDLKQFLEIPQVASRLLQKIYQTMTPDEQSVILQIAVLQRPVVFKVICELCERQDIRQIISNLVRKTLVIYDERLKNYRLHDVIRDFHRSQLTDEQRKAYHLKAAAYYERQDFNQDLPTFQQMQDRLDARHHYFQAGDITKAARLLLDIAEPYRVWGYLQQCKMFIHETLKKLEAFPLTTERQGLIIDLLVEQSWIERSVSGFDKAITCCQQAENLLNTVTDQRHAGKVYHALGRFNYDQGKWEQSQTYLTRSFELRKQAGDLKGLMKVLTDLYAWYWDCGEVEEIGTIIEEGINVCKKAGDQENHAEIIVTTLGSLLHNQGRFDEALPFYEESLRLRKADNFYGKANSLRLIGQTFWQKKDFKQALQWYEEALEFAKQSQDDIMQAYILREIGDTHRDARNIEEAIKYYQATHKIAETSENLLGRIIAFTRLGWSYARTHKIDEALKYYQRFRDMYQELGDNVGDTDGLNSLGGIYLQRYSELEKALQYFQESIVTREKIGRWLTIGTELNNVAFVYIEQGKLEEALEILEDLRIKETRRIGVIVDNLNYTGLIYRLHGKFQEALDIHTESLRIFEKARRFDGKSTILNYLGEDYLALGEYAEALNSLEKSFRYPLLFYKKAEPMTNIADVYFRQGKLAEALAKCEESLALSRQFGGRIQAGVTLHLMAKILMQQGRPAALPYIQEAVAMFRDTGSRHLAEAEKMFNVIQEQLAKERA